MAKTELGTKRVCPTTGRKFYDLNRDPIVSPYTGEVIPRATFEPPTRGASAPAPRPKEEPEEEAEAAPAGAEVISLEEVGASEEANAEEPEDDAADEGADAETFLEEEEEGNDDVSDLVDSDIADDEEG